MQIQFPDHTGYPGGKVFNRAALRRCLTDSKGLSDAMFCADSVLPADTALPRQFRLAECVALRFRSMFFNVLNHPNLGNPTNILTGPLFGRSTQTLANGLGNGGANGGFNPLYQIGDPRSIQLAVELIF
jgi:hypothetical protein